MDSLLELLCDVDGFCKAFPPVWQNRLLTSGAIQRQRERSLSVSEIMTILIYFHQSHYHSPAPSTPRQAKPASGRHTAGEQSRAEKTRQARTLERSDRPKATLAGDTPHHAPPPSARFSIFKVLPICAQRPSSAAAGAE